MNRIAFSLAFCLAAALPVFADPLRPADVPDPLKPWTGWVMKGNESQTCPFLSGRGEKQCAWPSELELTLGASGGTFRQEWQISAETWIALPGSQENWPLDLKVNGKPGPVTDLNGQPQVALKPGAYAVTGSFSWKQPPDSLQVPAGTGLISLSWMGKPVPFPVRDESGRVWLQKTQAAPAETDSLDLKAYRYIVDAIPLQMTTRLLLNVSGRNREVPLKGLLLPGFVPMGLDSPLPVRLDPNGEIRIQLRPGTWTVSLTGRHTGPVMELTLPEAAPGWPVEELWAFEAQNNLRLVSVEGVTAVDPRQTTLPGEWQHLPTYRLTPGETMRFIEKRRGDSTPAPDQVSLSRNLWLDFDGSGFTVQDRLSGQVRRSSRIEMLAPALLGRVSVDGEDQVISRREDSPNAGFELRRGELNVLADSRLEKTGSSFTAAGWDVDVDSLSATLELPPGWRLFHASGADRVSNTWLTRWTLLDFFGVLVTALAFFRLWGPHWGTAALVAFTVTYTESGAPVWIWVVIAGAEALLRVLDPGKLRRALVGFRISAIFALALIAIPFAVRQLRIAMYPALEYPSGSPGGEYGMGMARQVLPASAPVQMAERAEPQTLEDAPAGMKSVRTKVARESYAGSGILGAVSMAASDAYVPQKKLEEIDPSASVNTGPGVPVWNWNRIELSWSGPVTRGQNLKLYLVPPWGNFVLAILRVGLIAALIFRLAREKHGTDGTKGAGAAAVLALSALAALSPAPAAAADFPPPEMLNELRTRLLAQYDCQPNCATLSRLSVEAKGNTLRLRLAASAAAPSAVALPGGVRQWSPSRATLDGRPDVPMYRTPDGILWLLLEPGAHEVVLEGPLPDREQVQIPLPAIPRQVTVLPGDWSVDGLRDDGGAESTLTLTRQMKRAATPDGSASSVELPPFLMLTRELRLGLEWRAVTTISRLSPPGTPAAAEIPLLDGESVTTPGIQVKNGRVMVTLGPQAYELSWESVLKPAAALELKAGDSTGRMEIWRLDASPIWHVEPDGIPPIHRLDESGRFNPEWQPWPGETLTLKISRPEGVPGQTFTIDRSKLALSPGSRTTDATLEFTARSSRGGQHPVTLPEGAELQSVTIGGAVQPVRQEGRTVTVPVSPGEQTVELRWREPSGIRTGFSPAPASLGAPSVNHSLEIRVPESRWILFLTGPRLGPAVLFWSLLAAVALVAVALGAVRFVPVSYLQWFLLGLGLSQIELWAAAIVPVWLLALGWRRENARKADGRAAYNFLQIIIVLLTLASLAALFAAVKQGLLGPMEMHISGNGSGRSLLRWFTDRTGTELPGATVISVPMWVYRAAMLAWSLWLAVTLIRWLRWGWESLNEGGLWRKAPEPPPGAPPAAEPPKKNYLAG